MAQGAKTEKVAVLGPSPTYSSMAALGLCQDVWVDSSFSSIREVVKAVSDGDALLGVVPLRNSSADVGDISDASKALDEYPEVAVILRREVPIDLSLIAQAGVGKSDIRTVVSKGQALGQCRRWLSDNVPGAVLVETGSTSEGMERVLRDPSVALVGSKEMIDDPDLQLLAGSIQDNPGNRTEFAVIVRPDVFGSPETEER